VINKFIQDETLWKLSILIDDVVVTLVLVVAVVLVTVNVTEVVTTIPIVVRLAIGVVVPRG
jgi:hypothetical protein